jgi:microcystin degradation protein MlrC
MKRRLLVARFAYASNAFHPAQAGLADFREQEWRSGDAALASDVAELAAVRAFAQAHPHWEVVVSRCASALTAGTLEDGVFDALCTEVAADAADGPWDAIYLSLHGAAATDTRGQLELELVRAIGEAAPGVPIAASFAAQANLPSALPAMLAFAAAGCSLSDRDRASSVLARLHARVEHGERLFPAIASSAMLIPCWPMVAESEAVREVEQLARESLSDAVVATSLVGGFPHADHTHAGAAVMAWSRGDAQPAREAAGRIARALLERRAALRPALPGANQALMQAGGDACVLLDVSDAPEAGGTGDTTLLLAALLARGAGSRAAFVGLHDPDTVQAAIDAGVGAVLDRRLGARLSRDYGAALPVRAVVLSLDIGPHGASVLLDAGGCDILATSSRAALTDLSLFAAHGIAPDSHPLLGLKAASAPPVVLAGWTRAIPVDTLGPAGLDLPSLPFNRLRPR